MLTTAQELLKTLRTRDTSMGDTALLQVRKIYEFIPKGQTNPIKNDKPLDPDLVFPDVQTLVSSLDAALERVPEKERVNLFCTLWHQSPEAEKRKKEDVGSARALTYLI